MNASHFVVGTRQSALARAQTALVTRAIQNARRVVPQEPIVVSERLITTQGDVSLAERLAGQIEKGFFTAELEAALLARSIDWAVHSLKDLPTRLPAGLGVVAVLPRASPADLLIVRPEAYADRGPTRLPLVPGARVGTSSLRRDALLRTHAPDCASLPLRGNVTTRVQRLHAHAYDAIVLAAAGISRLAMSLDGFTVVELDPRRFQTAPGQGAVAVEARTDDARVLEVLAPLEHAPTRQHTELERALLRTLEGGCSTPFGCFVDGVHAHLGSWSNARWVEATVPVNAIESEASRQSVLAALERRAHDPITPQTDTEAFHDRLSLWRLHT